MPFIIFLASLTHILILASLCGLAYGLACGDGRVTKKGKDNKRSLTSCFCLKCNSLVSTRRYLFALPL